MALIRSRMAEAVAAGVQARELHHVRRLRSVGHTRRGPLHVWACGREGGRTDGAV